MYNKKNPQMYLLILIQYMNWVHAETIKETFFSQ